MIVEYVDSESPAERFEIRKYDVLTHFKDQALVNPAQLGALIEESVKDEEIPIRYLREGKQGTLSVRLSDREWILRVSDDSSGIRFVSDSLTVGRESKNRSVLIITQDPRGSVELVVKSDSSWILIKDNKGQKIYEGNFKTEADRAELPAAFGKSLELIRSFEEKIVVGYLKQTFGLLRDDPEVAFVSDFSKLASRKVAVVNE